jgi:hypothetical protein
MLRAAYWPGLSIIQLEVLDKLSVLVVGRYPYKISVETRENNVVVRKFDWPSFTWQKSRCGIKIWLPRYFSGDALLKDKRA